MSEKKLDPTKVHIEMEIPLREAGSELERLHNVQVVANIKKQLEIFAHSLIEERMRAIGIIPIPDEHYERPLHVRYNIGTTGINPDRPEKNVGLEQSWVDDAKTLMSEITRLTAENTALRKQLVDSELSKISDKSSYEVDGHFYESGK